MTFNEWWYDFRIKNSGKQPREAVAQAAWVASRMELIRDRRAEPLDTENAAVTVNGVKHCPTCTPDRTCWHNPGEPCQT